MKTIVRCLIGISFLAVGVLLMGCSHTGSPEMADLQKQLTQKESEIRELASRNEEKDQTIEQYRTKLGEQVRATSEAETRAEQARQTQQTGMGSAEAALFPPMAKPGECYARVFVPPAYKTVAERVLKTSSSEQLEVIPAKYEWAQEKVLVKEASERMEVVPAQYEWVEERVLVKPASTKLEKVPARYEWKEEKVLVKEAHTVWKTGRGPVQRVDNITGEIMCLVEVPATYKTVRKKVMVAPPTTRTVEIPAEYQTVKKRVMVKPPTYQKIQIPAEYNTVKVSKLVSAPQERRIEIPAEYQTVTKTKLVKEGRMEWRRILCETNVTPQAISRIQTALLKAGYDPGPADGLLGARTRDAIKAYQKDHKLARGGLTYETLQSLGIQL
ncbi:MAG: peptidoglycan-binding protein [Desulfobacterales bacterium]|nr:MAG: peptidoglycan-binding protein [Desulfobacterales bacterium]